MNVQETYVKDRVNWRHIIVEYVYTQFIAFYPR